MGLVGVRGLATFSLEPGGHAATYRYHFLSNLADIPDTSI